MRTLAPVLALLAAATLQAKDATAPATLGAAEFRASPDHPFGWRGDGTGRYPAATPVLEWSLTKNVRWSVEAGKGYASPILAGDLILLLSEPNLLQAFHRVDGILAWKKTISTADLADPAARAVADDYKAKDTGFAAATPVTDGSTIYVILANGMVQAVDMAGKAKWTSFIDARQNTAYGRSASPVLTAGKLIVHMTNLYAFDPATGKQLWTSTEARCQYGTPAAFRQATTNLVVTPAGDVFNVDDGKTLNSQIGATANSSPLAQDGLVYFAEKDVRAIRLGADFKDESVWNGEIGSDLFASPVLHDGLLFTVTGKGELLIFDATRKGESQPLFDPRPLFGDDGHVYSSFALAGRHLFLPSLEGDVVVLEATREAKVVARNKLKDGSGSAPVFAGKHLFLRDGDRLYCIGE